LKVKLQNLENKNRVLRTSSILRCSTKMDLEKIYVGQKAHVKTELGCVEISSLSMSKNTQNPKKGAFSEIKK
jgi:hypothetical protein